MVKAPVLDQQVRRFESRRLDLSLGCWTYYLCNPSVWGAEVYTRILRPGGDTWKTTRKVIMIRWFQPGNTHYQGERAKSLRYRRGGLGGRVRWRQTSCILPTWVDHSGPNFQGVITTYGRTFSNVWFFKKTQI